MASSTDPDLHFASRHADLLGELPAAWWVRLGVQPVLTFEYGKLVRRRPPTVFDAVDGNRQRFDNV